MTKDPRNPDDVRAAARWTLGLAQEQIYQQLNDQDIETSDYLDQADKLAQRLITLDAALAIIEGREALNNLGRSPTGPH